MTKTKIKNYEKEKFENYVKIMSGIIKTTVLEMTNGEEVDLFPTKENILTRACEKFSKLKQIGVYDNLNRLVLTAGK